MSILKFESGNSYSTAAKTFFSISIVFSIYSRPLSEFLFDDLQLGLFWAGVGLLLLSLVPILEVLFHLFVYILFDRNLPKGSFRYWGTLRQPSWEQFTNNLIGDYYLLGGLTMILVKVLIFDPTFFDSDSLFGMTLQISWILSVSILLLEAIIIINLSLRIKSNALNIQLSQFFLTRVKINRIPSKDAQTAYLNKAWPLFRYECFIEFDTLSSQLKSWIRNYDQLSQADPINFGGILNYISDLGDKLRKIRIDFHPQFKDFGFEILLDIKQRIDLLIEFEIVIRKRKRVSNSIELLFTNPPNWGAVRKRLDQSDIDEVVSKRLSGYPQDSRLELDLSTNEWIQTLHKNLEQLRRDLSLFLTEFDSYLSIKFHRSY